MTNDANKHMTNDASKHLKAALIKKAEKRWDDAYKDALVLFRHRDLEVRQLAHALCSMRRHDFWTILGGMESLNTYEEYRYGEAVGRLEFIKFFIGHELLDGGCPGLSYYFHHHVPKFPGGVSKMHPYFHRNHDLLIDTEPSATPLCVTTTLEVLQTFVDARPRQVAALKRRLTATGRAAEVSTDTFDGVMVTLADELAFEALK